MTRTATTRGLILLTFTPLSGLSDVVLMFCPVAIFTNSKTRNPADRILATWDDVPHLDERARRCCSRRTCHSSGMRAPREFLLSAVAQSIRYQSRILSFLILRCPITGRALMAWMSDGTGRRQFGARLTGKPRPAISTRSIIEEKQSRLFMLRRSSREANGFLAPLIRRRAVDRSLMGISLLEMYQSMGLDLTPANNAVESGIYDVWTLLSAGKLKVFASCADWISEYRMYRRDDKGRVVKRTTT